MNESRGIGTKVGGIPDGSVATIGAQILSTTALVCPYKVKTPTGQLSKDGPGPGPVSDARTKPKTKEFLKEE